MTIGLYRNQHCEKFNFNTQKVYIAFNVIFKIFAQIFYLLLMHFKELFRIKFFFRLEKNHNTLQNINANCNNLIVNNFNLYRVECSSTSDIHLLPCSWIQTRINIYKLYIFNILFVISSLWMFLLCLIQNGELKYIAESKLVI